MLELQKLVEVCSTVQYGFTASATTDPLGPKFLRITDIQGGRFDWSAVPYCVASSGEAEKYRLRTGDIVVARTGNSTGENAQLRSNPPQAVFASYLIMFRPDPALANPVFVGYQLRTGRFQDFVHSVRGGSAQPGANAKQLGAFEIQLPARDEQDKVAAFLSSIDDRIELLRQTNTTLEAIAQALFKSWFVDFDPVHAKAEGREPEAMDAATPALFPSELEESELGLIPKGWRQSSLGDVCASKGGCIQTGPFGSQLHASDYVPVGVPVVMPQDLAGRRVAEDKVARVPSSDADRLARHKLKSGDIVFSRRGDVGRHAVVSEREVGWLCGTGCLLVRPGESESISTFVSAALARPESLEWLVRNAVGATMPNLNTKILSRLPIISPPDELVRAFERIASPLEHRVSANHAQMKSLADLRDTLLPRLISGKLRLPEVRVEVEEAMQESAK